MVLWSASTRARAVDGTHSIRPSWEEVGKTLHQGEAEWDCLTIPSLLRVTSLLCNAHDI